MSAEAWQRDMGLRISIEGMNYPAENLDYFRHAAAMMREMEIEEIRVEVLDKPYPSTIKVRILNGTTPRTLVNFWNIVLEGTALRDRSKTDPSISPSDIDLAMRKKAGEIYLQKAMELIR